jgi:dolichol kinase
MLNLEGRRKIFHLLAISLWLIPLKFFPNWLITFSFLFIIILNLLLVNRIGIKFLPTLYRIVLYFEREKNLQKPGIQALWANLGIALGFLLFGKECAVVGVLLLAIGDAFAGFVGAKIGKLKLWEKTLEGFMAFFFSTFCVLYFFLGFEKALVVSLIGATVELLPLKLDDNFTLPVVGSFMCFALK